MPILNKNELIAGGLASALADIGAGSTPLVFEPSFDWDFTKYPVRVRRERQGLYSSDFNPRTDVPDFKAIFDGVAAGTTQVVYADASKADNSGNALTAATAKRGVYAAWQAAEAVAGKTATLLMVAPGDYDRSIDFLGTGAGGPFYPSRPIAVVGYGGVAPLIGPFILNVPWAPDGAGFSATRASYARCTNKLSKDSYGKERPFTWFATKAAALASTGVDAVFFDTATNLLTIKRADGATPSDANTRVLVEANSCSPGPMPFYAQGIDWIGGQSGCLQRNNNTASTPIVLEDCALLVPGVDTKDLGNAAATDYPGLLALVRCHFGFTRRDAVSPNGVNCTADNRHHLLVIGCTASAIGDRQLSCNVTTGHGNDVATASGGTGFGIRLIEVGTNGYLSAGGARRFIGRTKAAICGGLTDGDRGDVAFGGTTPSMAVASEDYAEVYVYEHSIRRCEIALSVTANAKLFVHAPVLGGGRVVANGTLTVI